MKVIDMHCDTIGELYEAEQRGESGSLLENGLHLDLKKMEKETIFFRISHCLWIWEPQRSPLKPVCPWQICFTGRWKKIGIGSGL